MLLAKLVHRDALEHQPLREARLQGRDFKDGIHLQDTRDMASVKITARLSTVPMWS